MSAVTAAAPRAVRGAPARRGVTLARVLAAEWTKLTSLRSTAWLAFGTVAATAATAYGLGLFVRAEDGRSGTGVVTSGSVLAQVGFLVLGVLVGTAEHSTGTARTTFTAVPRRLPVLAGQALVTAAAALGTAGAALGASVLATSGVRSSVPLALDLHDPGTVRALAGFLLLHTGVALLGVGLGSLLRRPADALVTGMLLVVVLDPLLATNPGRVTDTLRALLPGAGGRLVQDDAALAALDAATHGPQLGTWGGGVVLAGWVVVALAAAAYRLRRHDL
ncbi:ABC transporter permease [Cellulomonas massiliensis]|uniref:ABC transporter permease n=1 Tax=Cellulomonas massiliensis TaxID=1465811 RepID=UPI0003069E54|nr:ABC transporter permease [Cellulomonas massiliensis]